MIFKQHFLIFFSIFLLCLPIASFSQENHIIVTSFSDSGSGTLREAFEIANRDGGPTKITFAQPGVILLLSSLPSLTESKTTIIGNVDFYGSSDVAVVAQASIFSGIKVEEASQITIRGITLRNFIENITIIGRVRDITIIGNTLDFDMNTFYPDPSIEFIKGISIVGEANNLLIQNNSIILPTKEDSPDKDQFGIQYRLGEIPGPAPLQSENIDRKWSKLHRTIVEL